MSEKIMIKYKTSDNRIIVLSEIDSKPQRTNKLSSFEKIKFAIEVSTFLAIIATLSVYVVLAILQYRANKIYHQQASIAQDTEQRELRAYVHTDITSVGLNLTGKTAKSTEIEFRTTNDGQTPASNVIIRSGVFLAPNPLPSGFKILLDKETNPRIAYIPAHSSADSSAKLDGRFSDDQLNELKDDNLRIYLFGEIEYRDIFDQTRHFRFGMCVLGDSIKDLIASGFPENKMEKCEYVSNFNFEY